MSYINKIKQRNYQRNWIAARRENFFRDKVCIKCGSNIALELDHIDPKEKISHNIWSWSEKRRNNELSKCQILCRNCHYDKTAKQIAQTEHGTATKYDKLHCRCRLCIAYNRRRARGLL